MELYTDNPLASTLFQRWVSVEWVISETWDWLSAGLQTISESIAPFKTKFQNEIGWENCPNSHQFYIISLYPKKTFKKSFHHSSQITLNCPIWCWQAWMSGKGISLIVHIIINCCFVPKLVATEQVWHTCIHTCRPTCMYAYLYY